LRTGVTRAAKKQKRVGTVAGVYPIHRPPPIGGLEDGPTSPPDNIAMTQILPGNRLARPESGQSQVSCLQPEWWWVEFA
jgi:hypothetical protein